MKQVPKKSRGRGERWWLNLIERQKRTGESVKALCARHGITAQGFYWRRKKLKGGKSAVGCFTEVEVGLVNEYEIRCRNGRSVVVRGAANVESLRTVLFCAEEVSL